MTTYSRIIGTGSYVPEKVLTNFDLEKIIDTSDQWIVEPTGIKERHIIAENETISDMSTEAAKQAIEAADIDKNDIDLIVVATIAGEYLAPSVACIVQRNLGITNNCPAFDMNGGCSGFAYGLNIVDNYIKSGAAKCVLLIATEALSKVTNWDDRTTCILFGDGSGAAVLKADNKPGIRSSHIYSDGSLYDMLLIPNSLYPCAGEPYATMRGKELFKIAVTRMGDLVQQTIEENNLTSDDIDWLVPHQANLRIITALAKRIKLPMEKVIVTIGEYGNTSASSLILALDHGVKSGKIKSGDTVLMDVFGAGVTWGSVLLDM